jgi:hypothetical protein
MQVNASALRAIVHAIVMGRPLVRAPGNPERRHWARLHARHQEWWQHENVVGLCVAKRQRRGKMGRLCVQVLVEKKYRDEKIAAKHRVPRTIESRAPRGSIETDVRAVGAGRLHSFVSNDKPAHPGFDIGNELGGSGTLGCVVIDNGTGQKLGLSCAHVVAPDGAADVGQTPGEVVYYPSFDNAQLLDVLGSARFGKLVRVASPGFSPEDAAGNVDAAVFAPDDTAWIDAKLADLNSAPRGVRRLVPIGLAVQKVGAVTQRTHGVVQTVTLAPKIPYADGEVAQFIDHIGISTFAEAGDSGSLVLDETGRAVGLHIGGFDGMSVCTPLGRVLAAVDCKLATRA